MTVELELSHCRQILEEIFLPYYLLGAELTFVLLPFL